MFLRVQRYFAVGVSCPAADHTKSVPSSCTSDGEVPPSAWWSQCGWKALPFTRYFNTEFCTGRAGCALGLNKFSRSSFLPSRCVARQRNVLPTRPRPGSAPHTSVPGFFQFPPANVANSAAARANLTDKPQPKESQTEPMEGNRPESFRVPREPSAVRGTGRTYRLVPSLPPDKSAFRCHPQHLKAGRNSSHPRTVNTRQD